MSKYSKMSFHYKLARFCLRLNKAYPFLGEVCMRVEKYRKETNGLASTDGRRFYLNEEEMSELPEEGLNHVLLHELLHIILRHRIPKGILACEYAYWQIGFDLVVNGILTQMSAQLRSRGLPIQPVAGAAICMDDLSRDSSNVIIKSFLEQARNQGIMSANPPLLVEIEWRSFRTIVPNDSAFEIDIGVGGDADESSVTELLVLSAKAAGDTGLPAFLKNLWDELTKGRKLPWDVIFRRYLHGMKTGEEYDYCPPDKRTLYAGLILPAETTDDGDELENALLVLDVSSSVDKKELLSQVWRVATVLSDLEFRGKIISFGSSVYQEAVLSTKRSLEKFINELKIGGGTNWARVVEYVGKMRRRPRPIVVYTDGYLYSFGAGLRDVVFVVASDDGDYPLELDKLGKVIVVPQ